ncbi:MAG: helix-turn-helix domain-containing protein [Balneolaceae bacterium]
MNLQKRLTAVEREQICIGLQQGLRPSAIARGLARHCSVITREINRNQTDGAGYSAITAHEKALERVCAPRSKKLGAHPELWQAGETVTAEFQQPNGSLLKASVTITE